MSIQSSTSKIPMGQKIAFGVGMLANQMFPAAISIFIVVLVQDLGFPGWMWGVVSLAPRILTRSLTLLWGLSLTTQNQNGEEEDSTFSLEQLSWGFHSSSCGNSLEIIPSTITLLIFFFGRLFFTSV